MVGSAASSARSAPVKNSLVYHLRQDLVCSRLTANAAANLTGKTSLMHAILGELDKTRGSVAVKGTIAYAAQVTPSGCSCTPILIVCSISLRLRARAQCLRHQLSAYTAIVAGVQSSFVMNCTLKDNGENPLNSSWVSEFPGMLYHFQQTHSKL